MKTYCAKELLEHINDCKKNESIKPGMDSVMVPYMSDAELNEYCRARSGEVKIYKLEAGV